MVITALAPNWNGVQRQSNAISNFADGEDVERVAADIVDGLVVVVSLSMDTRGRSAGDTAGLRLRLRVFEQFLLVDGTELGCLTPACTTHHMPLHCGL